MEKTTLYLPKELQVALREAARREGRSQADVAREALERYVSGSDIPRPRSLGAFEQDRTRGQAVPARDAKRWVREQWEAQSPPREQRRASRPEAAPRQA